MGHSEEKWLKWMGKPSRRLDKMRKEDSEKHSLTWPEMFCPFSTLGSTDHFNIVSSKFKTLYPDGPPVSVVGLDVNNIWVQKLGHTTKPYLFNHLTGEFAKVNVVSSSWPTPERAPWFQFNSA